MKKNKVKSKTKKIPKSSPKDKFRFSSTTGQLLPLQTIRQRFVGIWKSLTWPVCVKILKANIAVTIALSFLLIEPIHKVAGTGAILASVAVEFVHPSKSYGFLAEDVVFGSIMCSFSAAWSIFGIYLASIVRDQNDSTLAQPRVCAILSCFLIFGCFCLNYFRVKVEQANVGGMLSASIMVISLTSAVLNTTFTAIPTLQLYISTLVGFALIFTCFFVIFPENSTRVFVQQLIKVFDTFDGLTQRQVNAFLRVSSASIIDPADIESSIANSNVLIDNLITALVQKKRMVRREPSYNCLAPTDVSEMTSLVKTLRVPLQGLGLSRAMEENMRKAVKTVFPESENAKDPDPAVDLNDILVEQQQQQGEEIDPKIRRPRSYYGGTDDEDDDDDTNTDDDLSNFSGPELPSVVNSTANSSTSSLASELTTNSHTRPRRRRIRWDDSMKVMTYWRQDYDDILNIVKPTYLELTDACSTAVSESIKRLRRMQDLDVRYENMPFFYKYYYRWKVGKEKEALERARDEYDSKVDPSAQLLEAIQRFHEHRLVGLEKLYTKSGVPRRILFLLLTFQFNLHKYAESIYTISSLIYELDQVRSERKFWWPHMSLRKWLFQSHNTSESIELDSPAAIVTVNHQNSLQKTLTRRATLERSQRTPSDVEKNQRVLYKLDTPHRGEAHSPREHHHQHPYDFAENPKGFINPWRQNTLDPLDYHDPDVAYPTTSRQMFFYKIYMFLLNHLYTTDAAFSFRAAVVVAFLSLPGFLEDSCRWYNEVRGQWAVVVALIWMGPSVGSNFFGTMTRTIGTFIGAVEAIVIWEISRGSVPGLIVLTFFGNLPWWMVYINGKFWRATGLFSLITISLILGYTYSFRPNGVPVSVFVVTWERTVDVLIGVIAAMLISIFPYPRTGRVVLRHRISQSLSELGALYSSFLALVLKNGPEDHATRLNNRKLFREVASSIRRQIQGERVLLDQSRFEPALRGVFPEHNYLHILQILDNILSLMLVMEFSLEKTDPHWRSMIVKDTWKERKEMISSFLIALHLGSNALTSKAPLPPYVLRPTKARRNLTNKTRKLPALKYQYLGQREYTYFSTYLMNSEQLAVEIELLIASICDLVGPDSVSIWLNYKH